MVNKYLLAIILLGLCTAVLAQDSRRPSKEDIFNRLSKGESVLAECDQKFEEEYVAKFGRKPARISLHEGPGYPVKLVKPRYPTVARDAQRSGQLVVEAVVDEKGKVVYASWKEGSRIFARAALDAIRASEFRPMIACGDKPVMFRRRVRYLFSPEM